MRWAGGIFIGWFLFFALPNPLFKDPTCMVIEDANGLLIGARIAKDGQWRFPYNAHVPEKFAVCIETFEDKRFRRHIGVDLSAIMRAFKDNLQAGGVVSGGSTLTMQTIRLSRKGQRRTLWEKAVEMVLAVRLELRCRKDEILSLYASNAPFGGNVVGLDAAAWRYYGKSPDLLSWGEAAALAVLPNAPSLVNPNKNRDILLKKRNRLLLELKERGVLDEMSCQLAMDEPLPDRPLPLPRLATHLTERAYRDFFKGKKNTINTRLKTTLDGGLQMHVERTLARHHAVLQGNGVDNIAALVVDVETGKVLAYAGNYNPYTDELAAVRPKEDFSEKGYDVDIIRAPRSTGSIIKPLLYSFMLHEGSLLPQNLLPDVPLYMDGFRPQNFFSTFDGAVTASKSISRSLNVPLVRMLQNYGIEKFYRQLKKFGFSTLTQPPEHYGLSLILGGAECTMWELATVYSGLARTLNHYNGVTHGIESINETGRYYKNDYHGLYYEPSQAPNLNPLTERATGSQPDLSAGAIWQTFETMREVERPNSEGNWQKFQTQQTIAWKTGTSFGFRDAWALGITSRYVVCVWTGNASGEGRPGLVGVQAAAPILFDIFNVLPAADWFAQPQSDMIKLAVCHESGYRPLPICPHIDTVWACKTSVLSDACPYHKMVHLDSTGRFQVTSECESPLLMRHIPWFVLPPVEEFYYRPLHADYLPLPPLRGDCALAQNDNPMQLIYPKKGSRIYIPVGYTGNVGKAVFKLAHRRPEVNVYWHIDRQYIGTTETFHQIEIETSPGKHLLTVVDANGNQVEEFFEVLAK